MSRERAQNHKHIETRLVLQVCTFSCCWCVDRFSLHQSRGLQKEHGIIGIGLPGLFFLSVQSQNDDSVRKMHCFGLFAMISLSESNFPELLPMRPYRGSDHTLLPRISQHQVAVHPIHVFFVRPQFWQCTGRVSYSIGEKNAINEYVTFRIIILIFHLRFSLFRKNAIGAITASATPAAANYKEASTLPWITIWIADSDPIKRLRLVVVSSMFWPFDVWIYTSTSLTFH